MPLTVKVPGRTPLHLVHLVLDLNGTIAAGGRLLPGVKKRILSVARMLDVTVLTADTYGGAGKALGTMPVRLHQVRSGKDKARFVAARDGVVAVGNGANDLGMIAEAELGIAVLGAEGTCAALVPVADLLVPSIDDAFDLLLDPRRLVATLRT
jgi:soluble P-type ATPase